ncbi:MAG: isocitrate lyase/phosphoenolpyruvate mutase family protein [Clostridiales bacterium]|jgi:2-methylisocitrate lyase-like PEP mutase family enzyme|nr:isocitrate lyase/phosphoenolpyruvate mutase family protein [Clostridiales bacterium]
MAKPNIKEMLAKEQLFVPCVYDCMSAKAAEIAGFKAMFLSGGATAYSQNGLPDMGFLNAEEMIAVVERITNVTDLPLLADADDGYGESPVVVYNTVKRLIKAGAAGFCIDDNTGIRGFERAEASRVDPSRPHLHPVISREAWLSKIKAALEACEGTDMLVIARTECALQEGFDEAIERCVRARELGCDMTLICGGLHDLETAKYVNKYDKGWKMFPDIFSVDGVPNAQLSDLEKEGFNLVTFHIFEKAALYGMMLYGSENMKNGNTVFSETHDLKGSVEAEELEKALTMNKDLWRARQRDFLDV